MDDAIKATIQIMQADESEIKIRSSYNLAAMTFTPAEIAEEIKNIIRIFTIDWSQILDKKIADSWPASIDDSFARKDWSWENDYDL
jgi:nucleoside-diphosphate-sugar epimerase